MWNLKIFNTQVELLIWRNNKSRRAILWIIRKMWKCSKCNLNCVMNFEKISRVISPKYLASKQICNAFKHELKLRVKFVWFFELEISIRAWIIYQLPLYLSCLRHGFTVIWRMDFIVQYLAWNCANNCTNVKRHLPRF